MDWLVERKRNSETKFVALPCQGDHVLGTESFVFLGSDSNGGTENSKLKWRLLFLGYIQTWYPPNWHKITQEILWWGCLWMQREMKKEEQKLQESFLGSNKNQSREKWGNYLDLFANCKALILVKTDIALSGFLIRCNSTSTGCHIS